jgi:Domain of unknown function (DUF4337)
MAWDKLNDDAARENKEIRDKWIGIYIGCLAVALAICALGGGNAAKDATLKNIDATNTWNFFQAKHLRRTNLELATDDLDLSLKTTPGLTSEAQKLISERIAARRADIVRLKSEPATGEGMEQLMAKAKGLEKERDEAMRRDPYFDYGQAFLQIAIVVASVALIMSGNMLLIMSAICAFIGALCTFNGFTMLFKLPFVG